MFLYARRLYWVTMEENAPLYMSKRWVLFTSDDPNEARELEKFLWVRVYALGE